MPDLDFHALVKAGEVVVADTGDAVADIDAGNGAADIVVRGTRPVDAFLRLEVNHLAGTDDEDTILSIDTCGVRHGVVSDDGAILLLGYIPGEVRVDDGRVAGPGAGSGGEITDGHLTEDVDDLLRHPEAERIRADFTDGLRNGHGADSERVVERLITDVGDSFIVADGEVCEVHAVGECLRVDFLELDAVAEVGRHETRAALEGGVVDVSQHRAVGEVRAL